MEMMLKLSLIFFAISFYSHVASARTRANPFFIDYYGDDSVIDDLRVRQPYMTPIQQQDENVQTINNQRTILNEGEVECKPRPIPVSIKVPGHFILTPQNVILNRCSGPGYTKFQKCDVKRREKVNVQYEILSAGNGGFTKTKKESVVMYNHLECGSACIVKPKDCNSKTQTYENCLCNCKLNSTYCESINRYYDQSSCQCYCKLPTQCPLYMEWNPATCQCECAECIKQMCSKHNLALDSVMCKCAANKRVSAF